MNTRPVFIINKPDEALTEEDLAAILKEQICALLPTNKLQYYRTPAEAIRDLEALSPDEIPEIFFFDAKDDETGCRTQGYWDFVEIANWFDEKMPNRFPKHVVFMSGDKWKNSDACKNLAIYQGYTKFPDTNFYAIAKIGLFNRNVLNLFVSIARNEITCETEDHAELRQFVIDVRDPTPEDALIVAHKYDNKTYSDNTYLHAEDDFDLFKDRICLFGTAYGENSCIGYVAHSIEDVLKNTEEGNTKSVLILPSYDIVYNFYLQQIAGIVLPSLGGFVHISSQVASKNIPILFMPEDQGRFNAALSIPRGEKVTMNVSSDKYNGLYKGFHTLLSEFPMKHLSDLDKVCREVIARNPCPQIPEFRATIDSISQINDAFRYTYEGFGLIRTGPISCADPETATALRHIFLGRGDRFDYNAFEERHEYFAKQMFSSFLDMKHSEKRLYVNYRPFDALAPEFLRRDEISELDKNIPKEFQRGIRASRFFPDLYRKQLNGACNALIDTNAHKALNFGITFPMLSEPQELDYANEVVDELEDSHGIEIRRGAMFETPGAVENVVKLARKLDHFSVGPRDLGDSYGVPTSNPLTGVVIVSPLAKLIVKSVHKMRAANKNIVVNYCCSYVTRQETLKKLDDARFDYFFVPPTQHSMALKVDYLRHCIHKNILALE